MKTIWTIAREEWRYWLRSNLVLSTVALFVAILVTVSLLTWMRMEAESAEREHHQVEAEETFLAQPDRHPHRMVHYGHYAFRTPAPLSLFDPGLDPVTGQSIFLEGHRQNSATFSNSSASANLGGLSWLTPALIYQLFAPLIIVLLGYGAITREREAKTLAPLLAQGVTGQALMAGKGLALLVFVVFLLLPLFVSTLFAAFMGEGETLLTALMLKFIYFLYLAIWCALTLVFSSLLKARSTVIATLVALWLSLNLVLPSVAVNVASWKAPVEGKIETDLRMISESRNLSDGHNVSESEMEQFKASLFKEQGVERLEDLSVNIRGIVSLNHEQHLTEVMNIYADQRMAGELRQAEIVAIHGWLTPMLAITNASRMLSGTDIKHYHRFLRQAEDIRYEFVQGLNTVHAAQLDYVADINRSVDEESSQKTRMDASNWQVLDQFKFAPAAFSERIKHSARSIFMLFVWMLMLTGFLAWISSRLKP